MFKNRLLAMLLAPFFSFAVDGGGGGGALDLENADRGDNLPDETDGLSNDEAKAAGEEVGLGDSADSAGDDEGDEEADDKEEKPTSKKKDSRIPLSRHEQILAKERERREALEAQLAQQQKQERQVQTDEFLASNETKLDDLEAKYNDALIDGKTDEARKLMKEIRTLEREIGDYKADMKAARAQEAAVEAVRFEAVVERLETAYPQLKPGSDEYDKDQVMEVLEMKEAFQMKGYSQSAALQKAVKYVIGASTVKEKQATEVTPRVTDGDVAEKVRADRKEAATEKAVKAIKGTPPSTKDTGLDSDKLGGSKLDGAAIMKMTQKDFAKLSEEDLARLRGDII